MSDYADQQFEVDSDGKEVWVHSLGWYAGERCTSPRMTYGADAHRGRCLEHDREVHRRGLDEARLPF